MSFLPQIWPKRKRVGLVLGGGAARGAAHVGVLYALLQAGIRPDCVAGTSAGSIVAALYAAGVPVEQMIDTALTINWGKLGQLTMPGLGFFDITRMESVMIDLMGYDFTIEQLKIPFACIATDLRTGEARELTTGSVAEAVRASCSLPSIFTPVRRAGRLLVDGGLINNLPVAAARRLGAEYVIAVDLLPWDEELPEPRSLTEVAVIAFFTLMRTAQNEASMADCVIQPKVAHINLADLSKVKVLIEEGRVATEHVVEQIRQDVGLKRNA